VTAAGIHQPLGAAQPRPAFRVALTSLRLGWLYLVSRRVPVALGLLVAIAALLSAALYWNWSIAGGPAAQQVIPLVTETGAAAVIAVTTYGPFGDTERATGRWLPWLRLGTALLLTAAAAGALAAGASGGHLPGGTLAMLRNVAGMSGTGLLAAATLGGAFAWTGPMAFMLVTEGALAGAWTTPWTWPARPPHDLGGALCACGVFVAGIAAVTLLGARDSSRRPAPE
jgi:hypothetical protein